MRRVAIVGAGVSGLTLAWQLLRDDPSVEVTVFEATGRVGGIIDTVRQDGFAIEMGPDSWVTEKPAARELAVELGLGEELIASNDATRKTLLLLDGRLVTIPDNLRMMVPVGREALADTDASPMLSAEARLAFHKELERAAELRRAAPTEDESIATFIGRHFGREVLRKLGAPLLSGVFGGDVRRLSVHAVMGPFVAMEREAGSLIAGLGEREAERRATGRAVRPIFTTLRSGLGTLTDALATRLPAGCLRLGTRVDRIARAGAGWEVRSVKRGGAEATAGVRCEVFERVVLASSAGANRQLLGQVDRPAARLLEQEASSAILVAFAWAEARLTLPQGFGFLVPAAEGRGGRGPRLLAGTFVDQKFDFRVPAGGQLVRVFFGTREAEQLLRAGASDAAIAGLAMRELRAVLGRPGSLPPATICLVRRWPASLPQYAVGHLERVARFERRMGAHGGLDVLGNALHGVGLPDLIRRARELGQAIARGGGGDAGRGGG